MVGNRFVAPFSHGSKVAQVFEQGFVFLDG